MNQTNHITTTTNDQATTYITVHQTSDADIALAILGAIGKLLMIVITSPVMVPLMVKAWKEAGPNDSTRLLD